MNNAITTARSICKKHNVKGCRKLAHGIFVGKQTERVPAEKSVQFLQDLQSAGFYVNQTSFNLAYKGLFDSTIIHKTI